MTNEIRFKFIVQAHVQKAFDLWSTEEGIGSFFSDDFDIEFKPGGKFEIYFIPDTLPGGRGGEGVKILAMEENSMLSFTWNFPPVIPSLREAQQSTVVHIYFKEVDNETSEIEFINSGYGKSEAWRQGVEYFTRAWGQVVLPRYRFVLEHGPVEDWENLPGISSYSLID